MSSENCGESSQKLGGGENSERPLKKARYVWEVKGKYHLKDSHNKSENKPSSSQDIPEQVSQEQVEEPRNENQNNIDDCENNNVVVNNNQEDCCRQAFLAKTGRIMSFYDTCMYAEEDSSDDERQNFGSATSAFARVPPTLVPKTKDYDYYLTRWQNRHIARGFVDNTINRVIESYSAGDGRHRLDFLDVCDMMEEESSNRNPGRVVEDEGITMAIQSHGLQAQDPLAETTTATIESFSKTQITQTDAQDDFKGDTQMQDSPCRDASEIRDELVDSGNADSLDSVSCDSLNHQDQDDFMNAAVSAAIQNKGLSSCTY